MKRRGGKYPNTIFQVGSLRKLEGARLSDLRTAGQDDRVDYYFFFFSNGEVPKIRDRR